MPMILVSEINVLDNEHRRYHRFYLPRIVEKGKRVYQQIVSFNSFFYGLKHRNQSNTTLFYGRHEDEPTLPLIEGVPIVTHANIWEFYKAIRFDWQKNKYYD